MAEKLVAVAKEAGAANAIIRVVFGDITFPLQKGMEREREREREKDEESKCRRNAERRMLSFLPIERVSSVYQDTEGRACFG